MNPEEIIEDMLSFVTTHTDHLGVAINRGLGKPQHIEKWMLVEMLVKLLELKMNGLLENAQGEHGYPNPKTNKSKERADLWWKTNDKENFLEVKTIIMPPNPRKLLCKDRREPILKDLDKINRLNSQNIFHHLVVFFNVKNDQLTELKSQLKSFYNKNGFTLEKDWEHDLGDDKKILYIALYLNT